jgi:hypothetical protein
MKEVKGATFDVGILKRMAFLLLNRLIVSKYWPQNEENWSSWRSEVALKSIGQLGPQNAKLNKLIGN